MSARAASRKDEEGRGERGRGSKKVEGEAWASVPQVTRSRRNPQRRPLQAAVGCQQQAPPYLLSSASRLASFASSSSSCSSSSPQSQTQFVTGCHSQVVLCSSLEKFPAKSQRGGWWRSTQIWGSPFVLKPMWVSGSQPRFLLANYPKTRQLG